MLCVLAPLVFMGCGESREAPAVALSKGEFVKQATSICEKRGAEKDTAVQQGLAQLNGSTPSTHDLEGLADLAIPAYRKMADELAELRPPVSDTRAVDAFLRRLQTAVKTIEKSPARLVHGEPFTSANGAAKAYGLDGCTL